MRRKMELNAMKINDNNFAGFKQDKKKRKPFKKAIETNK